MPPTLYGAPRIVIKNIDIDRMDIFSHGLWAGAAAKGINLKKERKLNVWLAAFWGAFPDLFAFAIPFTWVFFNLISGNVSLSDLHPHTGAEPENKLNFGRGDTNQTDPYIARFTAVLYDISHSLIVFIIIFTLVIIAFKLLKKERIIPWEMGGWLLHILSDIPTHSYAFYPTPIFWPINGWKLNGYSWAHPLFIAVNYSAIAIAYLAIRYFEKNKK